MYFCPESKPTLRLESEELESYQSEIAQKLSADGATVKVKVGQSRIEGKLLIVAKGNIEATSAVIKRVRDAIVS